MPIRKMAIVKKYAKEHAFILAYYDLPIEVVSYNSCPPEYQIVSVQYKGIMPFPVETRTLRAKISVYMPQQNTRLPPNLTNIPKQLNELLNPAFANQRKYKWEMGW